MELKLVQIDLARQKENVEFIKQYTQHYIYLSSYRVYADSKLPMWKKLGVNLKAGKCK